MRLLDRDSRGLPRLKELSGDDIPPYAILSHPWGLREVTFEDVQKSRAEGKVGYRKIELCLEQAARDGLQYCWVDTCYINKTDLAELSEAINSIFRWYQNAHRSYAYLSDVSDESFRSRRWFTRGWTLQELLTPRRVEFFNVDGQRISDKASLIQDIHERTQIPVAALQGAPLAQLQVDERMSWMVRRRMTREEDRVYSLLGIFEISMPLVYGEGRRQIGACSIRKSRSCVSPLILGLRSSKMRRPESID